MKLFKQFVGRLTAGLSACQLFPEMPTVHFHPGFYDCPVCGSVLKVLKTRKKRLITMDIGAFYARETVLNCPHDEKIFYSEQLRSIVPKGATFGFDVIVNVGFLFVRCRNNNEIMKELALKNISISEREISYLGRKFIIYLALSHRESKHRLRELMARRGGYILHLDGTCEGDSPNLFCGFDGISELVLDTIKIPSEKKDKLIPFFSRIKEQYGDPKALVHDMGRGIISAVEAVFPEVEDFICHFHFLRDLGKDLLQNEYNALKKQLKKLNVRSKLRQRAKYIENKINPDSPVYKEIIASFEDGEWKTKSFEESPLITTYVLIQWVFDYPRQSNGYGFPFDRSLLDFHQRLQTACRLIDKIKDIHLRGQIKDNKPFFQIYAIIKETVKDRQLNKLAANLEQKADVFDKLRTAMRITLPESKNGINDNGDDNDMKSIEKNVTEFRKWLVCDNKRKVTYAKMLKQLDKYWEKLFADPLPVFTPEGTIYIQPQRTNNLLERFFREEKRRYRKKSGMISLNKVLKAILADTPLVQNLKNNEYMDIILNGSSSLAERFSKIDAHLVQKEMEKAKKSNEKILPAVKKLIKRSDLTEKISSLFSSCGNG